MFGYVYLVLNKVNGNTYVGKHKSSKLWNEDKYPGSGTLLKPAKKKYGKQNFEKFLIQYCETEDELNRQEKFWISEYRKRGKAEYNIADGGEGCAYWRGKHRSLETRKKLSKVIKALEPRRGFKFSEEAKKHMSEAQKKVKGFVWWNNGVTETKSKVCPGEGYVRGRICKPFNRKHSDESKEKMRAAFKGRHWIMVDGKRKWV